MDNGEEESMVAFEGHAHLRHSTAVVSRTGILLLKKRAASWNKYR